MWVNFIPLLIWLLFLFPILMGSQLIAEKSKSYKESELSESEQVEILAKFYFGGSIFWFIVGVACIVIELRLA